MKGESRWMIVWRRAVGRHNIIPRRFRLLWSAGARKVIRI